MTENEAILDGNQFPDEIVSAERHSNTVQFQSKSGFCLVLTVMRADVIGFRYNIEPDSPPEFSYALSENFETGVDSIHFSDEGDSFKLTTSSLVCTVTKQSMKVSIADINGLVLTEDELGFHWWENHEHGGIVPKMSKCNYSGECFYGMGDKPMSLNLAGKRLKNWNTDEYAFLPDQDPLYKSIPFYISLRNSLAYGIFFDNTFATHFDFGCEREDVTSFWADGGEMNYYFIYGPEIEAVASTYVQLTGMPELPPLWALGYHQSKWSYYPEARVRDIAKQFRQNRIPCDAIYLDIDYMDGFRCFTWDQERFPQPKALIDDLRESGFHTVVIIDPGIKIDNDYSVYREGVEKGYFCRRGDGPFLKGKVWPGDCLFPDFTNPEVRKWWAGLYKPLIDVGIYGVWNDMNEPALMEVPSKTAPLDVRHDFDGHPCSHRKAHNVYGMQMARATHEGLKNLAYPRRPFVITRAAYSGTQRYCSTWTGDNIANWDHLKVANMQMQRINLSGMGFCGSDIGGFEEQPQPELYARWIQLGVFHPLCRTHSSGHHGDQEPWVFGKKVLDVTRRYISLRYELLLYLYTTFYEYSRFGTPMLRSLVMEDQGDQNLIEAEDDFMFGRHILVCPITEGKAVKSRSIYLPQGQWYDFWSNEKHHGKMAFEVPVSLQDIPIFVRAGAVIPRLPVQQFVGESKENKLRLDVYHSEHETSSRVYEDFFDGYDYKISGYLLRTFSTVGDTGELVLTQEREGKYESKYKTLHFHFIGLTFKIREVIVDDKPLIYPQDDLNKDVVQVPEDFKKITLKV